MEQLYHLKLFPELSQAIALGYTHHFRLLVDDSLQCLSCPEKYYQFDEVLPQFIYCPLRKATIYLIITRDGLYKGTFVDYWESSDNNF